MIMLLFQSSSRLSKIFISLLFLSLDSSCHRLVGIFLCPHWYSWTIFFFLIHTPLYLWITVIIWNHLLLELSAVIYYSFGGMFLFIPWKILVPGSLFTGPINVKEISVAYFLFRLHCEMVEKRKALFHVIIQVFRRWRLWILHLLISKVILMVKILVEKRKNNVSKWDVFLTRWGLQMWCDDWVEVCGMESERIHPRQDRGESWLHTLQGGGRQEAEERLFARR